MGNMRKEVRRAKEARLDGNGHSDEFPDLVMVILSAGPCLDLEYNPVVSPIIRCDISLITHSSAVGQVTIGQIQTFVLVRPCDLPSVGEFGRNGKFELLVCVAGVAGVDLQFVTVCGGAVGDV
jgi:hypothetical protein